MALVEWVESDTAPEILVGTKYGDDDVTKTQAQRSTFHSSHIRIV